jgi:hypothetical protein
MSYEVGIPFEYGVNDCYTLVRNIVKREHDYDLGEIEYVNINQIDVLEQYLATWKGWERTRRLERGVIIVFLLKSLCRVHLGYGISESKFYHSAPTCGSVITVYTDTWRRLTHSIWRKK